MEYFPLEDPIATVELPDRDGHEGPFTTGGQPKQGYLYPVVDDYATAVREMFADKWPPGSPWSGAERHYWLFQANPKQWSLSENLSQMPPGHVENWVVTRHRKDMQPGDAVVLWEGGSAAGVYAFGRLANTPTLKPTLDFRPESAGEQEYSVDVLIEQHVIPPITRDEARAHQVLASLDVLRRPWGGTNLAMTREQWLAVRKMTPIEPGEHRRSPLGTTCPMGQEVRLDGGLRLFRTCIQARDPRPVGRST